MHCNAGYFVQILKNSFPQVTLPCTPEHLGKFVVVWKHAEEVKTKWGKFLYRWCWYCYVFYDPFVHDNYEQENIAYVFLLTILPPIFS